MSTLSLSSFTKIHQGSGEVENVKVYGQTDDNGRTDDWRCAMTIAHLSLWLRWAKNRDGMILCNWLWTIRKRGGGVCWTEKWNWNLLQRQYKAGKRHMWITKLQNKCVCNFITVGYIHVHIWKYRGYQKGITHQGVVCSSKISEIIHAIYQDFFQNVFFSIET